MATIIELNNFIQAKLKELNRSEINAVELAEILDVAGLLKDNVSRPGLSLRQYLRSNKIKGGFQYPNKRWVVKKVDYEPLFSIKDAADKIDMTEQAIYKKIERKQITVEQIEGRVAIPASELGLTDDLKEAETPDNIYNELNIIKNELINIYQRVENLSHKLTGSTKTKGGSMLTLHEEIAAILKNREDH